MQNLENLDVFEILITQKLLKCPKDPFVRSVLNILIGGWERETLYVLEADSKVEQQLFILINANILFKLARTKTFCL